MLQKYSLESECAQSTSWRIIGKHASEGKRAEEGRECSSRHQEIAVLGSCLPGSQYDGVSPDPLRNPVSPHFIKMERSPLPSTDKRTLQQECSSVQEGNDTPATLCISTMFILLNYLSKLYVYLPNNRFYFSYISQTARKSIACSHAVIFSWASHWDHETHRNWPKWWFFSILPRARPFMMTPEEDFNVLHLRVFWINPLEAPRLRILLVFS